MVRSISKKAPPWRRLPVSGRIVFVEITVFNLVCPPVKVRSLRARLLSVKLLLFLYGGKTFWHDVELNILASRSSLRLLIQSGLRTSSFQGTWLWVSPPPALYESRLPWASACLKGKHVGDQEDEPNAGMWNAW
jgi:hypothetical protein